MCHQSAGLSPDGVHAHILGVVSGPVGVLLLGPITLICTNFFQQSKIIQLLEEQNDELRLARYDRSTDVSEP